MKIKTELYGIFYRNHNCTWSGPYQGDMYNKKHDAEEEEKCVRQIVKKETKIMRLTWED